MADGEIPPFYAQPKWFAVQVALRHERKVALMLGYKGCVHFLPAYKSKSTWTDRARLIEQPLFPGYVFCQITRPLARHVLGMSGVRRIVTFGGRPYPLSDEEILVLLHVSSGEDVQPSQYLAIGERVEITSGPFAGISGFLTDFKNQQKLVISVDLIQKSVSIDIDISSVAASARAKSGFGRDSGISAGLGRDQQQPVKCTGRIDAMLRPSNMQTSRSGMRGIEAGMYGRLQVELASTGAEVNCPRDLQ